MRDFVLGRRHFARVETRFCALFSATCASLGQSALGMAYPRFAEAIDDLVLWVPGIGRYAWHCLIICHKSPAGFSRTFLAGAPSQAVTDNGGGDASTSLELARWRRP